MENEEHITFPNHKERQRDFDCSLGFAMTVIGSKWRAILLWHILKADVLRYGQVKKSVPMISHKVLSQELKNLEADGLIRRTVQPTKPPTVEYSITPLGKTLEKALAELCLWGQQFMK